MAGLSKRKAVGVSGLPVDWRLLSMTAESAGLAWLVWNVGSGAFWCIDPRGVLGLEDETVEGQDIESWLTGLFPTEPGGVLAPLLAEAEDRRDVMVECSLAERLVQLEGVVFRDASGRCFGSALIRDVTEVRAAAARLVAGEGRFRNIFETAPVPMVLEDASHRLVDVNQAFEAMAGHRREALVGRLARELGFWSSAHEQADIRRYVNEGGRGVVELSLRTAAGRLKHVLASITPGQIDGSPGYVMLLLDVTEHNVTRRRLMEALRGAMQEDTGLGESFMAKLTQLGGDSERVGLSVLTGRERQVLARLADGKGTEAIAAELALAPSTVRNYMSGVYQKLGVGSRAEAIVWAREHGLGGE